MRTISAEDLRATLDYADLVERIRAFFKEPVTVPVRHHHTIAMADDPDATLLLMPAWSEGTALGVKIATVFPGNGERGLPAVMASYILLDGATGEPVAMIDGPELTARRTAAASALASSYLSRTDSASLLMVGTGVMAPHLIRAHRSQRPIERVLIWGRTPVKAEALAERMRAEGVEAEVVGQLETATPTADIISCATLSRTPLVHGAWLVPGQHVDLVGAFTPEMRETDDAAVARARVYVDTRDGALEEGGDIVQAMASGAIAREDVNGDLFDLTRGRVRGRTGAEEITLFKSTGTALEDLAAATLAYERVNQP